MHVCTWVCSECQEPSGSPAMFSPFNCLLCQDPLPLPRMKMRCIYREYFIKIPENVEHFFVVQASAHKWVTYSPIGLPAKLTFKHSLKYFSFKKVQEFSSLDILNWLYWLEIPWNGTAQLFDNSVAPQVHS